MNVKLLDLQAQYLPLRNEIRRAMDEVCDQQALILGPHVERFEKHLAAYCQTKHAIGVSSGTDALLCSLIDSLSGPTTRARIWRGLTQAGAVEKTREQHAAILDAIATRRPELARSWATVHVAGVEDWLRIALQDPVG